jgi:hypothetical protein
VNRTVLNRQLTQFALFPSIDSLFWVSHCLPGQRFDLNKYKRRTPGSAWIDRNKINLAQSGAVGTGYDLVAFFFEEASGQRLALLSERTGTSKKAQPFESHRESACQTQLIKTISFDPSAAL